MSTVFDEIQATKRLLEDNRQTVYSLEERGYPSADPILHDRRILVKSLELYLNVLEKTVNAQSRRSSVITMETVISDGREKKSPYNGRDAKH